MAGVVNKCLACGQEAYDMEACDCPKGRSEKAQGRLTYGATADPRLRLLSDEEIADARRLLSEVRRFFLWR
jgi:hypothetical protein